MTLFIRRFSCSRNGAASARTRLLPCLERLETRALLTAGAIDPTFGTLGTLTTDFQGTFDVATAALVQPNGMTVVAGSTRNPAAGSPFSFALARYDVHGVLDPGFGTGGQSTVAAGALFLTALTPGGAILAAGQETDGSVSVVRFTSGGLVDTAFGTTGIATIHFSMGAQPDGLAVLADGSVLVAGNEVIGLTVNGQVRQGFEAKLTPQGSLDTTFGTAGIATSPSALVDSILLQGNKILVGLESAGVAVTRLNSDGTLDTTFGTNGVAAAGFSKASSTTTAILLQPDGKIVAAGTDGTGFAIARFSPDGILDATFGSGGRVSTVFASQPAAVQQLSILPQGQIKAVGLSGPSTALQHNVAAAQYTPIGSLDSSFGRFGKFNNSAFSGADFRGVAFGGTDKIVAAGATAFGATGGSDFLVNRYAVTAGVDSSIPASQRFVTQLYLDLLGRPVDNPGLTYWSNRIDAGASNTTVAQGITASTEFLTHEVNLLYKDLLNRAADPTGLNGYVSFLQAGGSTTQVQAAICASDEYFLKAGNTTNGFLGTMYEDMLGRPIDQTGLAAWTAFLNAGGTRAALTNAIAQSLEFRTFLVQNTYQTLLYRSADVTGLKAWTDALAAGTTQQALTAFFAGSPEYAIPL